jgi:ribosomal protein L11 methyltransferase
VWATVCEEVTMSLAVVLRCRDDETELMGDRLFALGASAVIERDVGGGMVELECDLGVEAVEELRRCGVDACSVDRDDGWRDAWREDAVAWRAGSVVVRPPWLPVELGPGETEVLIDPGDAFGSGGHPSTRGCLDLLQARIAATGGSWDVLDVGCGSGVLGIAAVMLGARRAVAIDVEAAALEATLRNASANGVLERVEASLRPLGSVPGGFDLVVANLLVPVIEELGSELVARVAPGGVLILGGLLESHRDRALHAVSAAGVLDERREEGWLTLAVEAPGLC